MRRGYTVVELTLVLALLALLLGIVLPRIAPLRDGGSAEQAAQEHAVAHGPMLHEPRGSAHLKFWMAQTSPPGVV